MRSPLLFAAAVAALVVACATGTNVDTSDDLSAGDYDSGSNNNNNNPNEYADSGSDPYQSANKDSGTTQFNGTDSGSTSKDSGTTTSSDSGTTTSKDSGTTTTGGDNCSGTKSAQRGNESYDNACVDYYEDIDEGDPIGTPCTPGGNDCSTYTNSDYLTYSPWCCFVPKSGSNCDMAYGSTPQCVPQ